MRQSRARNFIEITKTTGNSVELRGNKHIPTMPNSGATQPLKAVSLKFGQGNSDTTTAAPVVAEESDESAEAESSDEPASNNSSQPPPLPEILSTESFTS